MAGPNFFIIGAPKCGTTSLYDWLSQHPDVFMSNPKEPCYFNRDYEYPFRIRDAEEYKKLFAKSTGHAAIGEATTSYLVSSVAVKNILKFRDGAKFIVCLRNPIDLFYSLHKQRVKEGAENLMSPRAAWQAQFERKFNQRIPYGVIENKTLLYGDLCMLGRQVRNLLNHVERSKILFLFLDDVASKPDDTFRTVCKFLEVREISLNSYNVANAGSVPTWPILQRYLRIIGIYRRRLGLPGLGIGSYLRRLNNRNNKIDFDPRLSDELSVYFKNDIEELGKLLNRDLSHWIINSRR